MINLQCNSARHREGMQTQLRTRSTARDTMSTTSSQTGGEGAGKAAYTGKDSGTGRTPCLHCDLAKRANSCGMLVSLLWACAPCDPTETVAPDVVVKAAAVLYGAHVVATSENELSCAPADAARLVKQPSARIRGCPVTFSMPMAFYRIARTDAGAVKCDMQHLAHAVAQAASTAVVVCPGLHHVLMCQRDINTAAHAMVELAFVRCAPVLLSLAPLAAPVTASAVA